MSNSEKREIGLKAVHSARADRKSNKYGKISGPVWLVGGGLVLAAVAISYFASDRSLGAAKEEILSQQRAAVATVGKEWEPLRDRIEKLTVDAATGDFKGDLVDPEASKWDFRGLPGIYLRLRVEDARNVDSLRKRARESVKDSFTGCLLRYSNPALAKGEPDAGTAPDQPWNLRQAYQATRVMTDEWAHEVKESNDKDRLRVFQQQYDKAKRDEIPLAIDIIKRAQFYLLVLDETTDGKTNEEELQQIAHPTRVHVVNLRTGKELARVRKAPEAGFQFVGGATATDPATIAAMKRQVNNCQLAQEVWGAIHPSPATPEPAPAGSK